MLTISSVDQALMKAKSHSKKGELLEAETLYRGILNNFSQNKRAEQGLADLNYRTAIAEFLSLPFDSPSYDVFFEFIEIKELNQFKFCNC
jgi:hypothetical protein